ncbi:MAG: hypothetical protein HZC47_08670 [Methanobacterium sp.]|uniref:hypothetical protein n=1 Tax=Methanobacterium sp. TaxID=2164 RepID=UPI003D655C2D|nr:hypothetical protein [Methanobacterium sp.]
MVGDTVPYEWHRLNNTFVNLLAIFGLIAIALAAMAMKESNISSMAVGGIAGFIGQKLLTNTQNESSNTTEPEQEIQKESSSTIESKSTDVDPEKELVITGDLTDDLEDDDTA